MEFRLGSIGPNRLIQSLSLVREVSSATLSEALGK